MDGTFAMIIACSALPPAFLAWIGVAAACRGFERFGMFVKIPLWLWFIILWGFFIIIELLVVPSSKQILSFVPAVIFMVGVLFWIIALIFGKKRAQQLQPNQGTMQDSLICTPEKAVVDKPTTLTRPGSPTKWTGAKIIKIVGLICLIVCCGYLTTAGYKKFKDPQALKEQEKTELSYNQALKEQEKAELSYKSPDESWEWHQKSQRIQIKRFDDGSICLRRVYMKDNYGIYAYKKDDYSLAAEVLFYVDCQPGTIITTTSKHSDGTPKELNCSEDGDYLWISVSWKSTNTNMTWIEDFGGFAFKEDFREWDFAKLDQHVTLSKAKTPAVTTSTAPSALKPAKLSVDTQPAYARIQILNINPKFEQGMEVEAGRYHVEVSADGYVTMRSWETLTEGESKFLNFVLVKAAAAPQPLTPVATPTAAESDSKYTYLGNGIVRDNRTGLMWQQATAPQRYRLNEARAYCEALLLGGYSDWRLPTKEELESLIDEHFMPRIHLRYFPDTKASSYWSTTPFVNSTNGNTMTVDFDKKGASRIAAVMVGTNCVRAVRGGP